MYINEINKKSLGHIGHIGHIYGPKKKMKKYLKNRYFSLAKHLYRCIILNMSKDIEKKLREAIVKSKMSRYKISQLSGVGEAQLSLFVNGKRTLTLTSAAKVAEVLGLDLRPKKGR